MVTSPGVQTRVARRTGRGATRWPLAVAAMVVAPVCLRVAALLAEADGLGVVDALGLASDLAMALLAAALLVAVGGRVFPVLLALLWTAAHYANYELVRVLGAPATLREAHYLFDPTFAAGSALAISSPGLLALLAIATLALSLAGSGGARSAALRLLPVGAVLALGVAVLPGVAGAPAWRQQDFLQRDLVLALRGALREAAPAEAFPDPPAAMLDRWPALAGDLAGEPRLAAGPRARNVLLLVLESVSGIHLASFAGEHGREPDAEMPRLDALAERSLRYVSFVAHQRKTNRGLYALLCGELPDLTGRTPKMSAAAESPWRVCLPSVLRDAGMHTAYLQAAPLAFMLKGAFMPRAGFSEVRGHDAFERSYTNSAWGVDDRAFLEQAADRIEALQGEGAPWFVTLLNVGTHHPYTVPDDFQPGRRSFRRAAAYLDEALGSFLERLERGGVLDDTLLLVTSDESAGIAGFDTQPTFKLVSQNWGILLARGPGVPTGVVREPYGLSDLALSVADYLGLAADAGHFFGRSVFRRYASPRDVFFANSNLGALGALEADGALLVCPDAGSCRRQPVPEQRYFAVLPEPAPAGDGDEGVVRLRELAERSAPAGERRPRDYALVSGSELRLADDRPHMLHGGQFIHLEPGEWLEVEYELAVEGEGAEIDWLHALTGHRNAGILRRHARIADGERVLLRYRFTPEEALGQLQCRTTVRLLSGSAAVLRHRVARLHIRSGADRPAPGIQLELFEIGSG